MLPLCNRALRPARTNKIFIMADVKENEMENFDAMYKRQIEFHQNIEKIEIAYVKTVEKYGEYEDCKAFAEYLRTIEKVFTEAKFNNWDAEKNKDELIKAKIMLLASGGSIQEDVLQSIYSDFRQSGTTLDKIYEIVNKLLEKYGDDQGCNEFILYLQYLAINFQEASRERLNNDQLKDRLVKARMEVLASGGEPDLSTLEKIYQEFKEMTK
jgi:hypothetical protein